MLPRGCPVLGGLYCSRSTVIVDSEWPRPDADAQAHSEKLIEHVRARINASDGWIGFAEYMHEVLYAPGLGYYSAGAHKFGEQGDFITAPELSPLYSRCIANQCAQILLATGGDTIVELGAGSGAMAAAMMGMLEELDTQPRHYQILEPSADLRARQRATFEQTAPDALSAVQWLDKPPKDINGLILGNEVLDALPVERFEIRDEAVFSVGVAWDGQRFADAVRPADDALCASVEAIQTHRGRKLADGYRSEVRPGLAEFISDWSNALSSGLMLWIDYGFSRADYYSARRNNGTLLCHYQHRAHEDPFVYPGLQDITAWVDFTTVAEAGVASGLTLSGFCTQAHFLMACGIEQQFTALRSRLGDEAQKMQLNDAVRRLMMPGEMGERFRVIALSRDLQIDPVGFSVRDLAASL